MQIQMADRKNDQLVFVPKLKMIVLCRLTNYLKNKTNMRDIYLNDCSKMTMYIL